MTIVEFLLARIAEDEATASRFKATWLEAGAPEADLVNDFGTYPSSEYTEIGLGLGRWLAECQAKRAIVDMHRSERIPDYDPGCSSDSWDASTEDCSELAALAEVYRDHPDFQKGWGIG
jgi:hypothetical protein